MSVRIQRPATETVALLQDAVRQAIAGAQVEASGSGGHFEIRVVSKAFAGKSTLERQRMVYRAIGHLMQGEGAPVHAVDRLETSVPEG